MVSTWNPRVWEPPPLRYPSLVIPNLQRRHLQDLPPSAFEGVPYSDSVAGLVLWLDGKDVNGDRLAEDASSFLAGGKVQSRQTVQAVPIHSPMFTSSKQPTYLNGGGLALTEQMISFPHRCQAPCPATWAYPLHRGQYQ